MLTQRADPFGANFIAGLNPVAWWRYGQGIVTGGQGVRIWDDVMGTELLLSLPGVAGNYGSTPDSPAVSITGDIDVRVRVALADWSPSAVQYLASKWNVTSNQRSWAFGVLSGGQLIFYQSVDGTSGTVGAFQSSVATGITDGAVKWVRAAFDVNNGGSRTCTFYTSDDGATWTQLGTAVTVGSAFNTFDSSATLDVGGIDAGATSPPNGRFYRAQIYSGIDGTLAAEFYPDRDATLGATSFASSTTGETWTVNATSTALAAAIHHGNALKQGVDGSRPSAEADGSILFPGVDEFLKASPFALVQPTTVMLVAKQITWTSGDSLFDGKTAVTGLLFQNGSTPTLQLNAGGVTACSASPALDSYVVIATVFDAASSLLQTNHNAPSTGNPGASAMGGLTLGARPTPSNYAHIQVMEGIVLPVALTADQIRHVATYLARVGGIGI